MADRLLENSKALERLSEEVESGFHTLEKSLKKNSMENNFRPGRGKENFIIFADF